MYLFVPFKVVNRLVLKQALGSFPSAGAAVSERLSTLLKEYPSQYDAESSQNQQKEIMQALDDELAPHSLESIIRQQVSLGGKFSRVPQDSVKVCILEGRARMIELRRDSIDSAAAVLFEPDEDARLLSHVILDSLLKVRACYLLPFPLC